MTRLFRVLGLAIVLGASSACVPPQPAPTSTVQSSGWQAEMLADLNAERSAHGRAPLAACGTLNAAAEAHSADQAAQNNMSHEGSDGSGPGDRVVRAGYLGWTTWGENVAAGYASVAAVMDAWMGSSGHRANILEPAFAHVGVGLAHSTGGTPYWTQVFGAGGTC